MRYRKPRFLHAIRFGYRIHHPASFIHPASCISSTILHLASTILHHVPMRFGAHVSIANHLSDSVDRAVSIGCEAMQIFPGNPRGWTPSYFTTGEIERFKLLRAEADIRPLSIHLPYLVNLASPVSRVYHASITSVKNSLDKAKLVEADFLIVHVGSHVGAGREAGLERINRALTELLEEDFGPVKLLLENTAGAGHTLGDRLEEIGGIFSTARDDPRLGLCLDTCHAWAAGYNLAEPAPLDDFMRQLDNLVGLERVGLVHANDCKEPLGGRLDRHEQIGRGHIGLDGFKHILARPEFGDMTFVIETPRPIAGDDMRNLAVLRSLISRS